MNKKLVSAVLCLALAGTASVALADIQSPPGDRDTPVRKLSRALANIVYGGLELPHTFERTLYEEGAEAAFSYGIVNGLDRSGARIGYGLYELVNFRTPKYKESFRAPYPSDKFDTVNGYVEFPPSVGFTATSYVRRQSY